MVSGLAEAPGQNPDTRGAACKAGLTEKRDAALKEIFGIDTVRELGTNRHFVLGGVLVALENKVG